MEAILFIGLQGAGKSSFYKQRFFSTHVRISLDLLKTRNRERHLLDACLSTNQRFVVDNTNPTRDDRSRYIELARQSRFSITGYYFQSQIEQCLIRNAGRNAAERVPDAAIRATTGKLELPTYNEGFHTLYYVQIQDGDYVIEDWRDEV